MAIMSSNAKFLKQTTSILEANKEIKSYINQQILDFEPFITPDTTILVIARDPALKDQEENEIENPAVVKNCAHRIVIILKEDDSSIEAEAFHDNIFAAIKLAKDKLVEDLLAIQNEMENSQERLNAIQQAGRADQIH